MFLIYGLPTLKQLVRMDKWRNDLLLYSMANDNDVIEPLSKFKNRVGDSFPLVIS